MHDITPQTPPAQAPAHAASSLPSSIQAVSDFSKPLMAVLSGKACRKEFFSALSHLLQQRFHFDRLCINLYDQQGEMLTYFTAAEGTVVSTLSPVRPAEPSTTVAGHVISSRKPVIITDFAEYFSESSIHPIAEAGLKATMAFPLLLDNDIIATLHCSFAEKPDDIFEITSFLLEISPLVATCLGAILSREQHRYNEIHLPAQPLIAPDVDSSIVCHSRAMREVMRKADAVAKLNIPVLLLGETGTGKSLLAQYLHRRSYCSSGHFVKVNCPSLTPTLFESELFGHAKGAFTGASAKRIGRFELAHGGTLFLDEIAELSPEMQSKLLQVLDDSRFERVGESISLAVDVRVVAATNVNVNDAMQRGRLRGDLFHRLSPCAIELPPLRHRIEDIAPLATMLSARISSSLGLPRLAFTPEMMVPLREHTWPGNVREMRNVITRLLLHNSIHKTADTDTVQSMLRHDSAFTSDAPPRSAADRAHALPEEGSAPPHSHSGHITETRDNMPESLAEAERRHILKTLEYTRGVIAGPSGAAALLGLPRSTLLHRMKKLNIVPETHSKFASRA